MSNFLLFYSFLLFVQIRIKSFFFVEKNVENIGVGGLFVFLAVTFWGILKRRVGHSQAINTAKFCYGLNVTHRFSQSPNFPQGPPIFLEFGGRPTSVAIMPSMVRCVRC